MQNRSDNKSGGAQTRAGSARLDKWLWAARFFKTRALAAQALAGGKVKINGERGKAAKCVRVGDELSIRIGPYAHTVRVKGLSGRRGPAQQAVSLYEETAESKTARAALAVQLRANRISSSPSKQRPGKHARRELIRLKQGSGRQQES